MAYFSICGLEFLKTIVLFEMNTFKFVENESLTHRVNFGKEPAFSKGPGTAFSEGPGPGLLYKVRCCILLLFALGIGAFGSNGNSTPKFSFSSCSFSSPSSLHMSDKFSLIDLSD